MWYRASVAEIPLLRLMGFAPQVRMLGLGVSPARAQTPAGYGRRLGKWRWTHMRSDRFNRILPFSPVGIRLVSLKTHDFKEFRPDTKQILTGL